MNMTRKTTLAMVAGTLLAGGALAGYATLGRGDYAEVTAVVPISELRPIYGEVLTVTEATAEVMVDREVCEEQVVERRRAERFGDKDGMLAGAVIGGLLGNQVGGGSGRKAATVAGAVGGALAGREIDRRHTGGQRYTDVDRVCELRPQPEQRVVGYDVEYRHDGQIGQLRSETRPQGPQVRIGEQATVVGFDVSWKLGERSGRLRMDHDPGSRLPLEALLPSDSAAEAPPARG